MLRIFIFILSILPVLCYSITGEEIIRAVDQNGVFKSVKGSGTMTINDNGRVRIKNMTLSSRKTFDLDEFFILFTNPEDRGVKYLKIGDELWMYLPDADDIMKISGHLLREGMMGSDISYEDMLNDKKLEESYSTVLTGETNYGGKKCYILEMTAVTNAITYYRRRSVIDESTMVPLETDLYAKSGRLLKKMIESDITVTGGRYFPEKMSMQDMRKNDSITVMKFSDIIIDEPMSPDIFSLQNLKK